jgi:cytochrome c oxidase subunit 3
MAHGAVKHDYHILPPSPWPFIGSASATMMALGLIAWIKGGVFGIEKGQWWLFALGISGVLYTMFGWWSDVVKEANAGDHTPGRVDRPALRHGAVHRLGSDVLRGVVLDLLRDGPVHHHRTLSGIEEVRAAWATWPPAGVEAVSPWHLPLVNTLTLLLSGTTITWSHHALQQGDRNGAKWGLILTILLGALFTTIQIYEYSHINHEHLFYSEAAANSGLYGSTFFLATGFHGFHVFVGTLFLIVCLIRLMNGAFTPKQHFGFEAAAWYWHFVDVVWLFLFAFVYVIFGASPH